MNSDELQNGRTAIIIRLVIAVTAIAGTALTFWVSGTVGFLALLVCLWVLMVVIQTHTPVEAGCVIVIIVVATAIGLGIMHLFRT